jgi:hypothetical protein
MRLAKEPERLPSEVDEHRGLSLAFALTIALNGWLDR